MPTIIATDLPNRVHSGKVRDTYDLEGERLLMVASDRISAYDVVFPNGIPDKGAVLAQLSAFWFDRTGHLVPNHLLDFAPDAAIDLDAEVARRSLVVRTRLHRRFGLERVQKAGHRGRAKHAP